jgi:hypothetical protein
MAEEQNF